MEVRPGYKRTEAGALPLEWEPTRAGAIGRFRGGNGFPIQHQGESEGDYPFYKVSDMNNPGADTFMVDANNWISEPVRRAVGANIFPDGTIVFAKVGAAVFLERKKILSRASCIDNNLAGFTLDRDRADVRFVHYQLLGTRLGDLVATTALPSLNGSVLAGIAIRLPPLSEQRAIAAALSDVDALLEGLTRLIAKKRDLKQAAMQQLLTGQTRLPGFHGKWEESTVGREFDVALGKMLDVEKNAGISKPYIGNRAVQWGRIQIDELQTVRLTPSELEKYRLSRGDLLVCEGGEVGRAAIWNAPLDECYYQKALHRLRSRRGMSAHFMAATLELWASRGVLENYVTQTSIAHLPREKFVAMPVLTPAIPEQTAIAAVLSDMDAELSALEARRDKTRAVKQAMMQELLTGRTRLV